MFEVILRKVGQTQLPKSDWPDLIETVATNFIRSAKDSRLSPWTLRQRLEGQVEAIPLAFMGVEIYTAYQKGLTYRGAVDFDDLIRLAAGMLDQSPDLLERLRYRWPFILEDEAQDSSQLQQEILSALAGPSGNWVRVGDPNQAIFETFTTANPDLLREFISRNPSVPMPESGRCQPSIIELANRLIIWTVSAHPVADVRSALAEPLIEPAPADDPQPNPANDPSGVMFVRAALTPDEEIQLVVKSLVAWLPDHRDCTVAVLASTNDHAANMVKALQARGIPCLELLRSTSPTRAVAGSLSHVLASLSDPGSSSKLAKAYRVWRRDWRGDRDREILIRRVASELTRLRRLEDFFTWGAFDIPSDPGAAASGIQAPLAEAEFQRRPASTAGRTGGFSHDRVSLAPGHRSAGRPTHPCALTGCVHLVCRLGTRPQAGAGNGPVGI